MARAKAARRRQRPQITPARAARLYRLLALLDHQPRERDELLATLGIGLRTFYRELKLLESVRIAVTHRNQQYRLKGSITTAEERLPFPDPKLSFAEIAELAQGTGAVAIRLGEMRRAMTGEQVRLPGPHAVVGAAESPGVPGNVGTPARKKGLTRKPI